MFLKNSACKKHVLSLLFVAAAGVSQSGCLLPLAVGAAGTGAYLGVQERGAKQALTDNKISLHIKKRLTETKGSYFSSISADVLHGNVLLSGIVPTAEAGGEVLDIVRRTPDVKNIYNELFVAPAYPASRKAKDVWLATKIKARLFGEREVYQVNYILSVVNSHVYVLGLAGSDAEHAHVVHVLRTTPGVAQVHDYIQLAPSAIVEVPPEEAQALENQRRSLFKEREVPPLLPSDLN